MDFTPHFSKLTAGNQRPWKQIMPSIQKKMKDVGLTIVPLRLFLSEKGWAKLEIAVAKGKKLHDKRNTLKDRDVQRDIDRASK